MNQNDQQATNQDALIEDLTVSADHAGDVNGGRAVEPSKDRLLNYTGLE